MKSPCIVLLALCTIAPAQSPVLKTKTAIGVTVDQWVGSNLTRHYKEIPANTTIGRNLHVSQGVGRSPYDQAGAQTTVQAHPSAHGGTFLIDESGNVFSNAAQYEVSTSTARATPKRAHEWLLEVPARTAGNTLSVTAFSFGNGLTHHVQLGIDVGDDGKFELQYDTKNGVIIRRFSLGTAASKVRITTLGTIPKGGHGRYGFKLGATLNPRQAFRFTDYSPTCGMKLTATDRLDDLGHHFRMTTDGAFAGRPVFFDFGVQKTNVPLPGSPCSLRLIPIAVVARIASAAGTAAYTNIDGFNPYLTRFTIPDGLRGKFYVQAIAIYDYRGLASIRASNAIEIDAGK